MRKSLSEIDFKNINVHAHMYVSGKMISVETIPGMGRGEYEGE
jgi:hypothetical protein